MSGSGRAAALLLLPVALACSPSGRAGGQDGDPRIPAPEFTVPDLAGRPVTLAELRGRTVVIDFWATWCAPCVFQVPELNRLWRRHRGGDDVAVFGMAVDVEGASVVAPWVEEQGVEYPILIGDEALAHSFGVLGFPTLVVVTPDGHIDSLHVGIVSADELEALLRDVHEAAARRPS